MSATDVFARRATLSGRCGCCRSSASNSPTRPGSTARWPRTPPRWSATCGGDSRRDPPRAGRCSTSAAGPATSPTAFEDAGLRLHRRRARPRARCTRARRRRGTPPTSAHPAWRCRSPTPAWTSACRRTSPSMCREPWRLGGEMLRVTRPGGLAVLSYTVWLGPFGGHEMGLTHYLGGARAAARYTRKHGHPAEEQLRLVIVRGLRRRRARLGGGHRRAGRRISPLPPTMGLVDDAGPAAAGVPGEQPGAGPAAAVIARLKQVLVLPDRG